jgi:hypothetical protein
MTQKQIWNIVNNNKNTNNINNYVDGIMNIIGRSLIFSLKPTSVSFIKVIIFTEMYFLLM